MLVVELGGRQRWPFRCETEISQVDTGSSGCFYLLGTQKLRIVEMRPAAVLVFGAVVWLPVVGDLEFILGVQPEKKIIDPPLPPFSRFNLLHTAGISFSFTSLKPIPLKKRKNNKRDCTVRGFRSFE